MSKTQASINELFASQVQRTLDVARIRGYLFPDQCDVGITLLSSTPTTYKVAARMDDVAIETTINIEAEAEDILKAVDHMVVPWLVRHAKTSAG